MADLIYNAMNNTVTLNSSDWAVGGSVVINGLVVGHVVDNNFVFDAVKQPAAEMIEPTPSLREVWRD